MIPLGGKGLFAMAVTTFVASLMMGAVNGDKVAILALAGVGAGSFVLGLAVTLAGSDLARPAAPGTPLADQAPAGARPSDPSLWPLAAAVGLGMLTLATAVNAILMVGAVVVLLIAGVGWALQNWREDPSYSPDLGRRVRERFVIPFGLPVGVVTLVGVIAISLSRVFLALPEDGTRAAALSVALIILIGAFSVAASTRMARAAMIALSSFALVALVAAGLVGLIHGQRKYEKPKFVVNPTALPGERPATTTTAVPGTSTTVAGSGAATTPTTVSSGAATTPTTVSSGAATTVSSGAATTTTVVGAATTVLGATPTTTTAP